ncbi:carbohydrate esterase family 10 protein [Ceratobasidium sp. AG-Ba]|nr:carbohydrate esterase family 10 protein [Ceratobasidium sp. AG-Ba]
MSPALFQRVIVLGLTALASAQATGPVIKSPNVSYVGVTNSTLELDYFLGVPYGKPPVGSLRFKPPQAWSPTNSSQVVDATTYGASCPQGNEQDLPAESEDCLSLNIWKPTNVTGKIPVLVWLYGGGFYFGNTLLYPGDMIVNASIVMKKPVIYVSPNYRTGFFGFPPGSAAAKAGALNLGLKDQRLALEWVQKNIGYFGGDPTKVTLFGQSAGAISTSYQALYKGGNTGNVFRGMILQSGSPSSVNVPPANDPVQEAAYKFVVNATGCAGSSNTFECVRSAPYDVLYKANQDVIKTPANSTGVDQGPVVLGPVLAPGDVFLPELPSVSVHAGRFAKVPFLSGSQLDEGTVFVNGEQPQTEQDMVNWLAAQLPGLYFGISNVTAVKELLKFYPTDPAAGSPLVSVVGDLIFQASRRDFTRTATKFGVKAWSYMFTEVVNPVGTKRYGVYHSGDLAYVFQAVHTMPDIPQPLVTLEQTVADYWFDFAYNLDPNKGASVPRPYWPIYGSNATTLQLASNITLIKDDFRKGALEYIINSPSLYN